MASETVPGVRAKLAVARKRAKEVARKNAPKISSVRALTPGIDSPKAARAAMAVKVDPSRTRDLTEEAAATA